MLKERLYYIDPYRTSFTAKVVRNGKDEQGHPYVVLENTAFYPTGGGQPHDTGTLNGIRVLDVEEVDGEIRHTLENAIASGTEVEGTIDWERRFDHMQQHTGQHILTAAFVELFNFPTVSFHLGKETVSIDIDTEDVTPTQLNAVEQRANQLILENRPIETKWVTEEELDQYKLRKDVAVTGDIRLVIIPEFDYNGCGGTHPSTTGQVSAIKILGTEKHRQKVRVHFVCGGRVVEQLTWKTAVLAKAAQSLSVPAEEVATAVQKLLETNRALEKSLNESQERLLVYEARELITSAEHSIVKASFKGRTIQELQKLARTIIAESADAIALLVGEQGDKLQFVAARGANVSISMKKASTYALSVLNGKGGGNDTFVQGGGEKLVSTAELLDGMGHAVKE